MPVKKIGNMNGKIKIKNKYRDGKVTNLTHTLSYCFSYNKHSKQRI